MVDKRLRKLHAARREMRPPARYGLPNAETILLCWGSTYGAGREAVDRLNAEEHSASMVCWGDLWPMVEEHAHAYLDGAKRLVGVESNATGQFARLLRAETGITLDHLVLRYDGRPLTAQYILDRLE